MPQHLPRRQHGFTYLGLIVLVTVIGLVGAATIKIESLLQRAAAEEELLAVGAAFSAALESYAAATPPGQ
jgi:type II secretory pathway pseudopilin PulG